MTVANKSGVIIGIHNPDTDETLPGGVTNAEGVVTILNVPRGRWEVVMSMPVDYLFNAGNIENAIADGNIANDAVGSLPFIVDVGKGTTSSTIIVITKKVYTLVTTFIDHGYTFKITRPTDADGEVVMYIQSEISSLPAPPSGHPKQSVLTIPVGALESNLITIDDYVALVTDGFGLKYKLYDASSNADVAITMDNLYVLNEDDYISY